MYNILIILCFKVLQPVRIGRQLTYRGEIYSENLTAGYLCLPFMQLLLSPVVKRWTVLGSAPVLRGNYLYSAISVRNTV